MFKRTQAEPQGTFMGDGDKVEAGEVGFRPNKIFRIFPGIDFGFFKQNKIFEIFKTEEKQVAIEPYDVEKLGDITTFEGVEGYEEIERYWVNEPFAFVSIQYAEKENDYLYFIVEPELTPFELKLLKDVYEQSRDTLSYRDLISGVDQQTILSKRVKEIINIYVKGLDERSFHKILYYVLRNNIGFGRIDPLMRDSRIEDISCSGPGIPVYLYHKNYENIRTSLVFEEEELNSFVILLAQRSGKHISVAKPYVDAALPGGSRLQETLGKEITSRGSSFTIRKFKETPMTPIDLIREGTFSAEMMAYIWLAIENNKSLLFVGGTASGKTTSLNAASLFIPYKSKIVTLEDTRELQLYHENWIAGVTRESFTGELKGTVDMYELLRQGLRQRPEFLIVGEVRGKEALTLFQAMSTGHTTYSTMHAGSVQAAVNRLESEPINVPRVMLTALDIMCVQGSVYLDGRRLRRVLAMVEILDLDPDTKHLNTMEVFRWNPVADTYNTLRDSPVLTEIMEQRGWDKKELERSLKIRAHILQYMLEHDISSYHDVVRILKTFQMSPEKVLQEIGG